MFRASWAPRASLPETYRALRLTAPGPTSNFELVTLPLRPPRPQEVLVKVRACAVAYRDVLDRRGAFKFIKCPIVLGHECAGSVVALGDGIDPNGRIRVGQRVVTLHWDQASAWPSPLTRGAAVPSMFGLMTDGGYAEYLYAAPGALVSAPTHLTAVEAASTVSTFGTVWQGAVVRGGLHIGDSVLVTGASGGVGSAAIQLASALGCSVTGCSSSAEKAAAITARFGASGCIVLPAKPPKSAFDVVIEAVGAPTFDASLRSVKPGGRLVVVGNITNAEVQLPLGYIILNSISIVGSDSIHAAEFERKLAPFMTRHSIKPVIAAVLPLQEAPRAHEMLESKSAMGRVVLQVAEDW